MKWFTGEEFSLLHALYEWYKLLHHDVTKYPKTERYTIGEKLKDFTLACIEGTWEAHALPLNERLLLLDRLQRKLDLMKLLIRLIYDLGIYQTKSYVHRQQQLQHIGKMLGGWRKATRRKLGVDP